ncbi:ATP-binding protein [Lutibacter sp.]|uniref:AlbA family DNA-binding domain-containing protein n=1 Tax=Lutibacter sp. TaxID=1925666 RepID=UPI0025C1827B|nr:ATP-binding protein [Lutibacter sp.]MCF6181180.1 ATP-binding protein [Lutibacter sp.]
MKTGTRVLSRLADKRVVILHTIFGALIFYLLFHPLTMIVYWYEFNKEPLTFSSFLNVLSHRTEHSFSYKMLEMSFIFSIMGGVTGLIFGLYKQNSKKLNKHIQLLNKDLLKLINQGENQFIELKSSVRYDFRQKTTNLDLEVVIAKTLAGFMNAKGGKLIIGVNDNKEILGLEKDFRTLKQQNTDGFEQKIYELISKYIGKEYCFYCTVYFHQLDKKTICVIAIDEVDEPVYLTKGKDTIFYIRTGNSTKPLTIKEAFHYIKMEKKS